jgi:transcriptional regulator with XRE-family HTH domain
MALVHGKQIVAARAMLGLSLNDVALLADLTPGIVATLENGDGPQPQYATVEAALAPLGVTFRDTQESIGVTIARIVDGMSIDTAIAVRWEARAAEARRVVATANGQRVAEVRAAVLRMFDEFRPAGRSMRHSVRLFFDSAELKGLRNIYGQRLRLSDRTLWRWLRLRAKKGEVGLAARHKGGRRSLFDQKPELRAQLVEIVKAASIVNSGEVAAEMWRCAPAFRHRLTRGVILREIARLLDQGVLGKITRATGRRAQRRVDQSTQLR